jgi:hypothetical protein
MTEVTQLRRQDALSTLFSDSLKAGAPAPLPPDVAARVVRLSEAGADAVAIAEHLKVDPSRISSLLRQRTEAQERSQRAKQPTPAAELQEAAELPVPAVEPVIEALEESALSLIELPSAPPAVPAWPADVALTELQQRAIKFVRRTVGLSLEALALAARTNPQQIARICGESP